MHTCACRHCVRTRVHIGMSVCTRLHMQLECACMFACASVSMQYVNVCAHLCAQLCASRCMCAHELRALCPCMYKHTVAPIFQAEEA